MDPKADADNQYGWAPYHYAFDNPIRYNDPMGDCPPDVDCGSYWLGFGASVIDNVTMGLTGVRGAAASYAGDASSFNTGQDQGDVAMVAVGAAMIEGGTGAAAGGAVVTVGSGGMAAPVSGTIAVGGVVTAVAGGAVVGKAAASLASRNGRVNSAGSEQMSRKEAIDKAKNHSQVPRKSKGGEEIGLNDLNPTSRGKNWQQMKGKGAKKLGQRNPNGKNQWMEHPDGHPDAGQPNVPKHHDSGHVHSTNRKGDTKIFPYNH